MSDIIILGGPNGAGKTTAARRLLPTQLQIREFVNADEIAQGLSPFNAAGAAIAAGRLMITRMRGLIASGESFAFETTCAGRGSVRLLQRAKDKGYRASLIFLWLPSVEAALDRVARRVAAGGHAIAKDVIARRYYAGLRNVTRFYLPLADLALIYDNSDGGPILIAERRPQAEMKIYDRARWKTIEDTTR
jgi:predicted ABC-type ATPase